MHHLPFECYSLLSDGRLPRCSARYPTSRLGHSADTSLLHLRRKGRSDIRQTRIRVRNASGSQDALEFVSKNVFESAADENVGRTVVIREYRNALQSRFAATDLELKESHHKFQRMDEYGVFA